jgi:hypothetical protein
MSIPVTAETRYLPEEFADLEPFAATWALPGLNERHAQRLASTMPELQAFYDVTVPRIEPAIEYLDQFPVDDLPEDAKHLFWLLCSVSLISFAVDVFKQPKVPDSGDGTLPALVEPGP